ncbi:unnamed protein product [Leuciscus chuanchicus]
MNLHGMNVRISPCCFQDLQSCVALPPHSNRERIIEPCEVEICAPSSRVESRREESKLATNESGQAGNSQENWVSLLLLGSLKSFYIILPPE